MPDAPELNLDNILSRETHPKLSQLDSDFYERASQLIQELEAEKRRVEPDSKYERDITDQLNVAKGQVRDIIQIRMHKIVGMARAQSVKRDKSDPPAMPREEIVFYTALLSLMTAWRQDCHNRFAKSWVKKEKGVLPEKKNPEKPNIPPENKKDIKINYILVRLLRIVPTFVGMDRRNYTLAKEDVVMVPAVNARALITRKAAVQIVLK